MGIYLNSDITVNNIIGNNIYSKIQSNTSRFLDNDKNGFDSILKKSKTDEKKKNEVYKSEAEGTSIEELRRQELKKIMNNQNLERTLNDFAQNLSRNYYMNPQFNGLINSAIKAFV